VILNTCKSNALRAIEAYEKGLNRVLAAERYGLTVEEFTLWARRAPPVIHSTRAFYKKILPAIDEYRAVLAETQASILKQLSAKYQIEYDDLLCASVDVELDVKKRGRPTTIPDDWQVVMVELHDTCGISYRDIRDWLEHEQRVKVTLSTVHDTIRRARERLRRPLVDDDFDQAEIVHDDDEETIDGW